MAVTSNGPECRPTRVVVSLLLSLSLAALVGGCSLTRRAEPPLHKAVWGGTNEVKAALEGADVDERDSTGCTALHLAASLHQEATVRLLLGHKADVHARQDEGATALILAARGIVLPSFTQGFSASTARILLEAASRTPRGAKAFVDATDNQGRTALMTAVLRTPRADVELLKVLIEHGADLDQKDREGLTTADWAARNGDCLALDLLASAGAKGGVCALARAPGASPTASPTATSATGSPGREEPDPVTGWTPLMFAAARGSKTAVEELLRRGASVEAQDLRGRTALFFAVSAARESLATTRLLLSGKASVQARARDGSTALHAAVDVCDQEVMELLLDHGADVNSATETGETTLMRAARQPCGEGLLLALLARKPAINARDKQGKTVLSRGVRPDVRMLLARNGATQ